jgi:hypothetical protein
MKQNGIKIDYDALRSPSHLNIFEKIKLNYFPNDQTKHIDYVIYYNDSPETDRNPKIKKIREKFIKQLTEKENFEIEKIVKNKDKPANSKSIYLLLNCSLDRS